jgi:hypothetical protein
MDLRDSIKSIVVSRGGVYSAKSETRFHLRESIKVTCGNGHSWNTLVETVLSGLWCQKCSQLERLHAVALSKGWECVSTEFKATHSIYAWRCGSGHEFKLNLISAERSSVCPVCKRLLECAEKLREVQELGIRLGGECISARFEKVDSSLRWRCKLGHEWMARVGNIERGTWCPKCAVDGQRSGIEEFHKIARERGGECLSTEYKNGHTKLRFACECGHEWMAVPLSIKRGTWCARCSGNAKKSLEDAANLAAKHGGQCLALNFPSVSSKLLWQCSRGHQWRGRYSDISSGSWCPLCVRGSRTFAELGGIANHHGGAILSRAFDFKNGMSLLQARCVEGHRFEIRARDLSHGSWCRQCIANTRRLPIERLREYAESRGGKVLSEKIQSQKGRTWIYFECGKGHAWRAQGSSVRSRRSWCKACSYENGRNVKDRDKGLSEKVDHSVKTVERNNVEMF